MNKKMFEEAMEQFNIICTSAQELEEKVENSNVAYESIILTAELQVDDNGGKFIVYDIAGSQPMEKEQLIAKLDTRDILEDANTIIKGNEK